MLNPGVLCSSLSTPVVTSWTTCATFKLGHMQLDANCSYLDVEHLEFYGLGRES